MTAQEFDNSFDVLYNNITSNQAPGLDSYEKSLFLTKAQDEIIKNYFLKQSNPKQAGFDDNQKRQADFSNLMATKELKTAGTTPVLTIGGVYVSQSNAFSTTLPNDCFIVVNERVTVNRSGSFAQLVVKPISYEEYDRLMQKPFKYPVHYQAWRLIVNNNNDAKKKIDVVIGPSDTLDSITVGGTSQPCKYVVRYIRKPKPIIVANLGELTIDGYKFEGQTLPTLATATSGCELDEILHQEILQRAVELAKIAWTANGQDNAQLVIQTGARSE